MEATMRSSLWNGVRKVKHLLRRARYAVLAPTPVSEAPRQTAVLLPAGLARLEGYTMSGARILEKQYRLGHDVAARQIPGDLVECGVCDGGSAAALAWGLGPGDRRVWLYDSFAGLPPTIELDGQFATGYVGACVGSEAKVREALATADVPDASTVVRRCWFQDTFLQPLPEVVCLLHLDCDWYESVMLSLNTFYDRVSDGGVILLDDFGHWEGCREAFYDFVQARGIKPLLERFGHTQAFWVKQRTHNRDYSGYWEIP